MGVRVSLPVCAVLLGPLSLQEVFQNDSAIPELGFGDALETKDERCKLALLHGFGVVGAFQIGPPFLNIITAIWYDSKVAQYVAAGGLAQLACAWWQQVFKPAGIGGPGSAKTGPLP